MDGRWLGKICSRYNCGLLLPARATKPSRLPLLLRRYPCNYHPVWNLALAWWYSFLPWIGEETSTMSQLWLLPEKARYEADLHQLSCTHSSIVEMRQTMRPQITNFFQSYRHQPLPQPELDNPPPRLRRGHPSLSWLSSRWDIWNERWTRHLLLHLMPDSETMTITPKAYTRLKSNGSGKSPIYFNAPREFSTSHVEPSYSLKNWRKRLIKW